MSVTEIPTNQPFHFNQASEPDSPPPGGLWLDGTSGFFKVRNSTNVAWNTISESQTPGVVWTSQASTEDNSWNAVAFGAGLFVAVAGSGTNRVMTSPDGVTWTARSASQANNWRSIAYSDTLTLFVAVSQDGTNRVMTSPDGITWTNRTAAEANTWNCVCWGGGLFVAVAGSGTNRVMTSPDGINWTARAAAEANTWEGVTYGNATYVAVAQTGTNRVMTSTDGTTWTARSAATASSWACVVYGSDVGLFVAGAFTTGALMSSPDGTTWTTRTNPTSGMSLEDITYGNGTFVAVSSAATSGNRVVTSTDGITWTSQLSAGDYQWSGVCYAIGIFVSVANFQSAAVGSGLLVMISPQSGNLLWTVRRKNKNQTTNNSTTLISDDTLKVKLAANKRYVIRLRAHYNTNASADFKYRITGPASPTIVERFSISGSASPPVIKNIAVAFDAADVALISANTDGIVFEDIIVHNGATAGILIFTWAQNTLNASNTTVYAGSYIEYCELL